MVMFAIGLDGCRCMMVVVIGCRALYTIRFFCHLLYTTGILTCQEDGKEECHKELWHPYNSELQESSEKRTRAHLANTGTSGYYYGS